MIPLHMADALTLRSTGMHFLPGVVYLGPFLLSRGVTGSSPGVVILLVIGVPSWLDHESTRLRLLLCSVCLFPWFYPICGILGIFFILLQSPLETLLGKRIPCW